MTDKDLKTIQPVYLQGATPFYRDEEINLIDLALVLTKRAKLVLGIFILLTIAAVAGALAIPKKHSFTSSISIGSQLVEGKLQNFESPGTVSAKLRYSFIPYLLKQRNSAPSSDKRKYKIQVTVPEGSNILILEAWGKPADEDIYKELLNTVSQALIDDHNRIYNALKQNLSAQLDTAHRELSRLGKTAEDMSKFSSIQDKMDKLNSQLSNLRPTSQILPPIMSDEPTGTSRKLIVAAGAIAGLLMGVFSAFLAELVEKVKDRRREPVQ